MATKTQMVQTGRMRALDRVAPTEDSPGFAWWKQGNRTASAHFAGKNPPPPGWGGASAGSNRGHDLIRALSPRQTRRAPEDAAWNPATREPYWRDVNGQRPKRQGA